VCEWWPTRRPDSNMLELCIRGGGWPRPIMRWVIMWFLEWASVREANNWYNPVPPANSNAACTAFKGRSLWLAEFQVLETNETSSIEGRMAPTLRHNNSERHSERSTYLSSGLFVWGIFSVYCRCLHKKSDTVSRGSGFIVNLLSICCA